MYCRWETEKKKTSPEARWADFAFKITSVDPTTMVKFFNFISFLTFLVS